MYISIPVHVMFIFYMHICICPISEATFCYCCIPLKAVQTTTQQHLCQEQNISLRNVSGPQWAAVSESPYPADGKEGASALMETRMDVSLWRRFVHYLPNTHQFSVRWAYTVLNYVVDECLCTWTFQTCATHAFLLLIQTWVYVIYPVYTTLHLWRLTVVLP